MVEKPSTVWECLSCGFIELVKDNPVYGFADWTGHIICPKCNANMKRKETVI